MWFEDKIFWTTEEGELFMFDGLDTKVLDFVTDAACVAIDWLGEKIYWSVYKNGVVSICLIVLIEVFMLNRTYLFLSY